MGVNLGGATQWSFSAAATHGADLGPRGMSYVADGKAFTPDIEVEETAFALDNGRLDGTAVCMERIDKARRRSASAVSVRLAGDRLQ